MSMFWLINVFQHLFSLSKIKLTLKYANKKGKQQAKARELYLSQLR